MRSWRSGGGLSKMRAEIVDTRRRLPVALIGGIGRGTQRRVHPHVGRDGTRWQAHGDILVTSGARTAALLDLRSRTFRKLSGDFPAAYRFATPTRHDRHGRSG